MDNHEDLLAYLNARIESERWHIKQLQDERRDLRNDPSTVQAWLDDVERELRSHHLRKNMINEILADIESGEMYEWI